MAARWQNPDRPRPASPVFADPQGKSLAVLSYQRSVREKIFYPEPVMASSLPSMAPARGAGPQGPRQRVGQPPVPASDEGDEGGDEQGPHDDRVEDLVDQAMGAVAGFPA